MMMILLLRMAQMLMLRINCSNNRSGFFHSLHTLLLIYFTVLRTPLGCWIVCGLMPRLSSLPMTMIMLLTMAKIFMLRRYSRTYRSYLFVLLNILIPISSTVLRTIVLFCMCLRTDATSNHFTNVHDNDDDDDCGGVDA